MGGEIGMDVEFGKHGTKLKAIECLAVFADPPMDDRSAIGRYQYPTRRITGEKTISIEARMRFKKRSVSRLIV
jgi:hypothetical protein